ncbi:GNAT family N-acetyltransferase [Kineococcus glutinatus]|uniref:GNAT family N-acetyltransferase n=1 Tax=Kineococcus glutinatus TaxID=1070872 RepID=A0ABP9IB88_9ACTN
MDLDAISLRTDRLLLRRWREEDLAPFAALNADPEVVEHLAAPLDRAGSDALAARGDGEFDRHGWGLWAVEVAEGPDAGRFAGFTGLLEQTFEAHFTPAVEVGWRLARWSWGRGYATEAATRALDVAFGDPAAGGAGLAEVVSITTPSNVRSQAVMRRLGMRRDPADDFDHSIAAGVAPYRHVLHRIDAATWRAHRGG